MSACDVIEDEDEDEEERLARLLAIMNDESQPADVRMKAASEALPLCHTPIPPKIIRTTGVSMSRAEWLCEARAGNLSDQSDQSD